MVLCSRVLPESTKDKVVFLSEEEEQEIQSEAGSSMDNAISEAVKEDGEIDWDCPCLQGMAQVRT